MEKTRILIEEEKDGIKVEINGNGADILDCLSLAVYDIHNTSNIPISNLTDVIASWATAHKVKQADENEKPFVILEDLLSK